MPITLNADQVAAIAKLNRSYAVIKMVLTEQPNSEEYIKVEMTLKAGKGTIEREFIMDGIGALVK